MSSGDMGISEKLAAQIQNQSAISRMTGISQSAISEAASGRRRLYVDQAFAIARALNISLDYLADDEQEEPPEPARVLTQDEELALSFYQSMREHEGAATPVLKVLAQMANAGLPRSGESRVPRRLMDVHGAQGTIYGPPIATADEGEPSPPHAGSSAKGAASEGKARYGRVIAQRDETEHHERLERERKAKTRRPKK